MPWVLEKTVGLGDPPGSAWSAVPCWWATPYEGSAVDDAGSSQCIKVLKTDQSVSLQHAECMFTLINDCLYAASVFCPLWSNHGNTVLALRTWSSTTFRPPWPVTGHTWLSVWWVLQPPAVVSRYWSLSLDQSNSLHASEGDSCWRRWARIRFSEKQRNLSTGIRVGRPLRFGGTFRRVVHGNPSYRFYVQLWLKVNNQEPDHCSWL